MSIPQTPPPAKYILSILSSRWQEDFWSALQPEIENYLGPVDFSSHLIPFTQTNYYDKELGMPIFRRLFSFKKLRAMDELPAVKIFTNNIETRESQRGKRGFNLDPGYITLERLVLATGKNFTHRVYLGQKIWADLTLIFQKGNWCDLPWTFPDYATETIKEHLTFIRQNYHTQIKSLTGQENKNREQ